MVLDGDIVCRCWNTMETSGDPTKHAEMTAVQQAALKLGRFKLPECTLYVTLEPCPMCAGAILQARVGTLVYAASNHLLGRLAGILDLICTHSAHAKRQELRCTSPVVWASSEEHKSLYCPLLCTKQIFCLFNFPVVFHPSRLIKRTSVCASTLQSYKCCSADPGHVTISFIVVLRSFCKQQFLQGLMEAGRHF